MVHPDADAVSVGTGAACTLGMVKKISVVKICALVLCLGHILVRIVVEIVAVKLHLVVEKRPAAIGSRHPGCGDAVPASPAALAAAHAALPAAHIAHHAAGKVVETAVVGVVAVQDDAQLLLVGEFSHKSSPLPAPVVGGSGGFLVGRRQVVSSSAHDVPESSFHHPGLDGDVYHFLFLAVVDAGEFRLFAFLVDHLELVDDLGRDILGCELGIVQEEGLSVYGYLADCLAVDADAAVFAHLDSGKLFKQVLKHVVVHCLEGGRIVFYGILLHQDRVARRGHARSIQHLRIRVHLESAQVQVRLDADVFFQILIPEQLYFEHIVPAAHILEMHGAGFAAEGVIGDFLRTGMRKGNRGEPHGFARIRICKFGTYNMLGIKTAACEQGRYQHGDTSKEHFHN